MRAHTFKMKAGIAMGVPSEGALTEDPENGQWKELCLVQPMMMGEG